MATTKVRAKQIFGIAEFPAPFIQSLIPDSYLPNATGDFVLKGAFFTPNTTVAFEGQTINAVNFINGTEIVVNATTNTQEGAYDVILNNGKESVYTNMLLLVLGTVIKPVSTDWNSVSNLDVSSGDFVKTKAFNSIGTAEWRIPIDYTIDFAIRFSAKTGRFGNPSLVNYGQKNISIKNVSDNAFQFGACIYNQTANSVKLLCYDKNFVEKVGANLVTTTRDEWFAFNQDVFEFRWLSGVMYCYVNSTILKQYITGLTENAYLSVLLNQFDLFNIKYIELN